MTKLLDIPADRPSPGRWQALLITALIMLFFLALQGETDPAPDSCAADTKEASYSRLSRE